MNKPAPELDYLLFFIFSPSLNSHKDHSWLMETLEEKIVFQLENLCTALGQFHNLSDTIIQHALSSSDYKVNSSRFIYIENVFKIEINTY